MFDEILNKPLLRYFESPLNIKVTLIDTFVVIKNTYAAHTRK